MSRRGSASEGEKLQVLLYRFGQNGLYTLSGKTHLLTQYCRANKHVFFIDHPTNKNNY